jgi:fumarate reductase flavoprotein subunit
MSGQTWDNEVDVVIAGAGGAGISAAIELAGAGVNTVVFEKQPTVDDASSSLCGGVWAFAGTDFQKRLGIEDSNDLFHQDLIALARGKSDEKLVRAYLDHQLDTYHWMTGLGVEWLAVEALAGMSVPRGHVTDPTATLRLLTDIAQRRGAKVIFETPITGLITDSTDRVVGVAAESRGKTQRVKASRGVLLATGGFGRDLERLATIDPRLRQVVPVVGPGHTGDGHRMAEERGAYLVDVEYVKPTFGIHADSTSNDSLSMMFYNGAIIVNQQGTRFIDESESYKDIGQAALSQTGSIGYQIFDQKIFQAGVERVKGLNPKKALWGLEETRIKRLVIGPTIEDLARKLSISPQVLKETVDRYNAGVKAGKDPDFGRTALAGRAGKILRIDTPPFYCYASKSLLPGTYGGIAVDENMHVLTRQGRIPGLYAAGEIVGGFHGASYMSGTAVGKAMIFGRIAARNLIASEAAP